MTDTELNHHGVKGMKWGVRRTPKQLGHKPAATKKKKSNIAAKKDEILKKLKNYKKTKDAEKAKKEAVKQKITAEEFEAKKQKAVLSGSAQEVLKFKGKLSQAEMNTAMNRIRWEQEMKTMSEKDIVTGRQKADKVFDNLDAVTNYAVTASKAYNTVANIYNAFSGTNKSLLPTINIDNTKSNRQQRKAEAEKAEERKKQKEKENLAELEKEAADAKAKKEAKKAQKAAEKEAKRNAKASTASSARTGKKASNVYEGTWTDVTPSEVPSSRMSLGQSYVAGLLEERR